MAGRILLALPISAVGEAYATVVAAGIMATCPTAMASTCLGAYAPTAAGIYRCHGNDYTRCTGGERNWCSMGWPRRGGACNTVGVRDFAGAPAAASPAPYSVGTSFDIHQSKRPRLLMHEWIGAPCCRSFLNPHLSQPYASCCFVQIVLFVSKNKADVH